MLIIMFPPTTTTTTNNNDNHTTDTDNDIIQRKLTKQTRTRTYIRAPYTPA